jgi:formylglycine-generating enzyme required for sulfatase activity
VATSYRNYDLLIERRARGYRARVQDSPAGEAAGDFALPFTAAELRTFSWLSSRVSQGLGLSASDNGPPAPLDIRQFGERLFNAAFAGDVGACLLLSLAATRKSDAGLRIRLRLDPDVPELAELPWEYLYAPQLDGFLALSDRTVLVRYVQQLHAPQALGVTPPLKLLVVAPQPNDVPPLKIEEEWNSLQRALAGLQGQDLLRMERLAAATPEALLDRLRSDVVHLLHFMGHSYFDPETRIGNLVLEDTQGRATFVSAAQLGAIVRDHAALRLVFLNACDGARGDQNDAFAGVAQQLVIQGVPAVVAMQFPVSDSASLTLTRKFYEGIANGEAVDTALTWARKAVSLAGPTETPPAEWGTPVLFSRSPDNRILALPERDARPVIPIQPWEPETVLIPAGPFLLGTGQGTGAPTWELPQQLLRLPGYRIGKYPVTNAQYLAFARERRIAVAAETGWPLASVGREPPPGREHHPVVGITWDDAVAYCRWLREKTGRRYRLPTETEWEKAARGAELSPEQTRLYPWGNCFEASRCNCAEDRRRDTSPVGSYSPQGDSPYGCADMAGNVWEWTSTRWGAERSRPQYATPYNPEDGRENPEPDQPFREYRVMRGGSYQDSAERVTCTVRGRDAANKNHARRGFRIVMDVGPGSTAPDGAAKAAKRS